MSLNFRQVQSFVRCFGLSNQTILDEMVHHVAIHQIWWNNFILALVLIISL
jgi:hypothetical protein